MRILITNERLDQRPGSDLFVRDLARGLQKRGHFVIAYCSDRRHRPRMLERDVIPVATDLENLPVRPDIIHARHHLDAMTAVMALPGVPAIHHCIGPACSVTLPVHPRIYRYVVPSRDAADWVGGHPGVPGDRIDIVLNAVDLLRFARVRRPSERLERILVYDDLLLPNSAVVNAIRRAASERRLAVDLVGRQFPRMVDDPEQHLPEYDMVFATGRKAIEALACGCAVVVVGPDRCGELVNDDNFGRLRASDFIADTKRPPGDIEEAFRRYSSDACSRLAARVRSDCDFGRYAAGIEAIYHEVIAAHRASIEDPDAEQRASSMYLARLASLLKEMDQAQKADGKIALSTASMLFDVSAKLVAIQADMDNPPM